MVLTDKYNDDASSQVQLLFTGTSHNNKMHSDANSLYACFSIINATPNPLMKMHKNSWDGCVVVYIVVGLSPLCTFFFYSRGLCAYYKSPILINTTVRHDSHSSANEIIMNVIWFRMDRVVQYTATD